MTTRLMLRLASLVSLLFAVGHSLGGLQNWSPIGDNAVLRAMTDVHFKTMGVSRSYLDLYVGLGWSVSVAMILQTVLLWQMASLAATNSVQLRPMIAVFILATLVSGVIAWVYILPIPAAFCGILLLTLVAAYLAPSGGSAPDGRR
jgi:hypothetical protein